MNLTWTGIVGIGAILATGWRYALGVIGYIQSFIICECDVSGDAAKALKRHFIKYGRKSPFGARVFSGETLFVFPKKRREIVAIEGFPPVPIVYRLGKFPVFVRLGNQREEASEKGLYSTHLKVWYLRGTINIDKLILRAVEEYNEFFRVDNDDHNRRKRFCIVRHSGSRGAKVSSDATERERDCPPTAAGSSSVLELIERGETRLLHWKPQDLVERSTDGEPFDYYPFPEAVLNHMDEIEMWLSSEKWFRSKGIPWRRGWLLYGPPGTGKSTLVKSIGVKYDLPVHIFDLSTHDNDSFVTDWCGNMLSRTPCIALIEDMDAVFKGRENIAVKNRDRDGLTFDCLLNTISGVGSSDGAFTIVTTNNVDSLDPAIGIPQESGESSRPGRIDRVIFLSKMLEPERRKLANFILADWPELIETVVMQGEGCTPAQFQERCAQLAIKQFWLKRKK